MGTGSGEYDLFDDEAESHAGQGPADALFTTTQRRILALLFDGVGHALSMRRLIALTRAGSGNVQRVVAKLVATGLLRVEASGNQKLYRANRDAPIHDELKGIIRKTHGVATPMRMALWPLMDRISFAVAWEAGAALELLIVAEALTYATVYEVLEPLMEELERQVHVDIERPMHLWTGRTTGSPLRRKRDDRTAIWITGRDSALAGLVFRQP